MANKHNPNAVRYSLLIHDAETLALINELAAKFKNRNAVLNDILKLGAPLYYSRVFGKDVAMQKEKQQHTPSVGREIKELRKDTDDLFVQLTLIETMIAGLYNVKIAELGGEAVNAEGLLDGSLCGLPELIAGIKADLIGATRGTETDGQ